MNATSAAMSATDATPMQPSSWLLPIIVGYWLASRRLEFLRSHFLVCGLFYGIAVFLVMNLVVLPVSAFPRPIGPFSVGVLYQGLLVHMFLVGLPISSSTRFL
jgi:hypothetical protein